MIRLILTTGLVLTLVPLGGCADTSGAESPAPPTARPEPPVIRTGSPARQFGPLVIDPGDIKLGAIEPNTVHEVELSLRNTGSSPLRIVKTSSDCKCTVPEDLDGTVIPPGGTHLLKATFTARASPGTKTAKILLNIFYGQGIKQAVTTIEGVVTMAVQATPPYVDALKGVRSGDVRVGSTDGRPFRIVSVNGDPPVYADGSDTAAPRTAYTLRWTNDYRPEGCTGSERLWWVIETDHPDCPVLPLRIRHECTGMRADPTYRQRGWLFSEYMTNLGSLAAGEPTEIDVDVRRINEQPTSGIYAVESLSPDATAELVTIVDMAPPSDVSTIRVRFTPRRGYEGLLYALVNFKARGGDKDTAFLARVQ